MKSAQLGRYICKVLLAVFMLGLSFELLISTQRVAADEAVAVPISVGGGSSHAIAAWSDGSVSGWGSNQYGQIGNGTFINQYVPVRIAELSDIVQVTAAWNHSYARSKSGQVWAWGQYMSKPARGTNLNTPNANAVIGNEDQAVPVLLDGIKHAIYIDAHQDKGIALQSDGSAVLWYFTYDDYPWNMEVRYRALGHFPGARAAVITNDYVLLLDGAGKVTRVKFYDTMQSSFLSSAHPDYQATLVTSIQQLGSVGEQAYMLRTDGRIMKWNEELQKPALIPGLADVEKLELISSNLIMLKKDGSLWRWNYMTKNNSKPIQIQVPHAGKIASIYGSGGDFWFAQLQDGALLAWQDRALLPWEEEAQIGLAAGIGKQASGKVNGAKVQFPLSYMANGREIRFKGTSAVIDGAIYVPANSVFQPLGITLSRSVTAPDPKEGNRSFNIWELAYKNQKLQISDRKPVQASLNGKPLQQQLKLEFLSDSTLFPLEDVCVLLGIRMHWNQATGAVSLTAE